MTSENVGSRGVLPDTEGARLAMQLTSIHHLRLELQWNLDLMPTSEQRQAAFRYLQVRLASGMKEVTMPSHCNSISLLARHLGEKPFEDASNDDLVLFLARRTFQHPRRKFRKDGTEVRETVTRRVGDSTIWLRTGILRGFYRFLVGDEKMAVLFKDLKMGSRPLLTVHSEDLLTWDEILAMMQALNHPRGRAMLALLCDCGPRSGALYALNVNSIRFEPDGTALIALPGQEPVRVFLSVPYLRYWVSMHPFRDQPFMPLFRQSRNPARRMRKGNLYCELTRWAAKAGIKRRVWPHLLPHTSATELAAAGMNEQMLRERMGWTPGSQMASAYVHLSMNDVSAAFRRFGALDPDETRRRGMLEPIVCPICSTENRLDATFCCRCGRRFRPRPRGVR